MKVKEYSINESKYLFFVDDLEIIQLPEDVNVSDDIVSDLIYQKQENINKYEFDISKIGNDEFKVISINLTNGCNLNCSYCFVEAFEKNVSLLKREQFDKIINFSLNGNERRVALYFSGTGEPLLNFKLLKEIPEILKENNISPDYYELNTNGTLINDEIACFFKDNNFIVNVSIDINEKQHNNTRKYINGDNSYDNVLKGLNILLKHKVNVACKTVITPDDKLLFNSFKIYEERALSYYFDIATPSIKGNYFPVEKDLNVFFDEFKRFNKYLIKKIKENKKVYSLRIMNDLKKLHNRQKKQIGCNACLGAFFINKKEEIYPCVYLADNEKSKIGDLESGIDKNKIKTKSFYAKDVNDYPFCKECHIKYLCGGGCFAIRFIENNKTDMQSNYMCSFYKKYWDELITMYIEIYNYIIDEENINYITYGDENNSACD